MPGQTMTSTWRMLSTRLTDPSCAILWKYNGKGVFFPLVSLAPGEEEEEEEEEDEEEEEEEEEDIAARKWAANSAIQTPYEATLAASDCGESRYMREYSHCPRR